MAVYFYVTTNIVFDEPAAIKRVSYVHVKGYSDGTKTIVITEEPVTDPNVTELSQSDAQVLLNSWTDEEPVQDRINLAVFFDQ